MFNWSEIICSDLCWVIVDKKLCAATKDWWNLHVLDRKLLITIILANCYDQNTSADIPIFLPHSSIKVNYSVFFFFINDFIINFPNLFIFYLFLRSF